MTTELDRRGFLRMSALGAGVISLPSPGPFGLMADHRTRSDKILVVVQMSGGNDGLNTVIPFENDDYHRARRSLAQRKHLKLDDTLALNENLGAMKELFDAGDLSIIQGVGYPNPNRSHFKSTDIWHSADPSKRSKKSGWIGRLGDQMTQKVYDPDFAINISQQPPLALTGKRYRPVSFQNAAAYRAALTKGQERAFEKIAASPAASDRDAILELVGQTAQDARVSSSAIREAAIAYKSPVEYGSSNLGKSLRTVSALINSGLSTRVYYVYHNGFDTHVNQAGKHPRLMSELATALGAFQKDLTRLGKTDRVATLAFSEFGRRVKENGSRGTDHGTAGPTFLLGAPVRGGILGEQPDLTDLDRGDLKFNTDFRRIYATLIDKWLGVNSAKILGAEFDHLPLLES